MSPLTRFRWPIIAALTICVGACVTYTGAKSGARPDRGLRFPHKTHIDEGIACTDCHAMEEGGQHIPNHDFCSTCHDFDVEKPEAEACGKCHTVDASEYTKPDYKRPPRVSLLGEERNFSHDTHLEKGLECAACHPDPNASTLPKGPIMTFCMDCHKKNKPESTACAVCHKEIDKNVRPKMLGQRRVPHDAPDVWRHLHGRESRINGVSCALCHESKDFCDECHRQNPPESHTISWRRTGHGLRATWDREKCSVCHEEDACRKCHENTAPVSHRATWGEPTNRHCLSCHFPADRTGCTVCHDAIDHRDAMPSPHDLGTFPPRCAACHPGGIPTRAPHIVNGSVRCTVCH